MHWFNYTISSFRSAPAYAGYYANYMCLLFAVDNKSAQCHGYTRFVWFFFFVFNGTHIPDSDRQKRTNEQGSAWPFLYKFHEHGRGGGYICMCTPFLPRSLAAFETFYAWSRLAHCDPSRYEWHRQSRRLDMIIIVYFSLFTRRRIRFRFHSFLSCGQFAIL